MAGGHLSTHRTTEYCDTWGCPSHRDVLVSGGGMRGGQVCWSPGALRALHPRPPAAPLSELGGGVPGQDGGLDFGWCHLGPLGDPGPARSLLGSSKDPATR